MRRRLCGGCTASASSSGTSRSVQPPIHHRQTPQAPACKAARDSRHARALAPHARWRRTRVRLFCSPDVRSPAPPSAADGGTFELEPLERLLGRMHRVASQQLWRQLNAAGLLPLL
eukprot:7391366-Prymnesium_polylepis.1